MKLSDILVRHRSQNINVESLPYISMLRINKHFIVYSIMILSSLLLTKLSFYETPSGGAWDDNITCE